MKKLGLLILLLGMGLSVSASDIPVVPGFSGLVNDVAGMQSSESQLKLLEQDRFRKEEYNEFQDMKQVKAARNKKVQLEQEYQDVQQQQRSQINSYSQDVNFVRENGRMMLKRVD